VVEILLLFILDLGWKVDRTFSLEDILNIQPCYVCQRRRENLWVYIYAFIYIYIHTHMYIHIHIYICIYTCKICRHMYWYLPVCIDTYKVRETWFLNEYNKECKKY